MRWLDGRPPGADLSRDRRPPAGRAPADGRLNAPARRAGLWGGCTSPPRVHHGRSAQNDASSPQGHPPSPTHPTGEVKAAFPSCRAVCLGLSEARPAALHTRTPPLAPLRHRELVSRSCSRPSVTPKTPKPPIQLWLVERDLIRKWPCKRWRTEAPVSSRSVGDVW